ncbi:MAG: phosphatase PAP2 family protein [Ignavibacteriaceae bacterium]
MENDIKFKSHNVFSYENDRRSKYWALIILISSILIFFLSALGLLDWLSELTSGFLLHKLDYTNKWSKSFGPAWFVNLNGEFSALGGFPLMFIFFTVSAIYYHLRRESRRLWRLLFIVVVGGLLLLVAKIIFAPEVPDELFEIMTNQISTFPSGHAMMGTIFYTTLAVAISRRQHSRKTKRLTLVTGTVIIILICISRILPGTHSVSEVFAGWSLGMIWLCLCWILERKIKRGLNKETLLAR